MPVIFGTCRIVAPAVVFADDAERQKCLRPWQAVEAKPAFAQGKDTKRGGFTAFLWSVGETVFTHRATVRFTLKNEAIGLIHGDCICRVACHKTFIVPAQEFSVIYYN